MVNMRYSFWYGKSVHSCDLNWVEDAVASLKNDEWKANTPLYMDGSGWDEKKRQDAAINLLGALSENKTARTLVVRNAVLESRALQSLEVAFQKNKHLESVSLRSLRTPAGQQVEIPVSVFQNPSLRELTLEKCILNRADCAELGKLLCSSGVTSLTLDNVTCEGGLGACLAMALPCSTCSLQTLTVRNTTLSTTDCNSFLKALQDNASLRTLHLEGLHLNEKHAEALAAVVHHHAHLQELSLRKNDLNHVAADTLFGGISSSATTLQTLFLSHNPIGDQGAASIVQNLSQNQNLSLQRLCLAHCEIWSAGCRTLAAGLGQMKSLRRLALDGNDVEPCGPDFLRALQQDNHTLTELVQSLPLLLRNVENELDDVGLQQWKEIAVCLKFNKAGRRVLAEPSASDLLPFVLQKTNNDMDVVFQFLQNHAWTTQ